MSVAMILAAGRGERLKPLTEMSPKALCMVKGKPLIEHHIINLAQAGFRQIVINHAYLGGQIRQYLGNGSRWGVEICYSPEPPGGLETGGGIVQALPLLGNQPFITVNADIYTDFDFKQIQLEHVAYLHLILINKNPAFLHHGDFGLINGTQPTNSACDYTFAGIACYHPQIFAQCTPGRYSVTPLIRNYVEQNKATASLHQGFWFDIGSVERLNAANNF
jgi:MurNAc alpha-1-phosphate uridylyltransferase